MELSTNGLELIKLYEGFRATPYNDTAGLKTIGFGHLIKPGEVFGAVSSVEATALLQRDVAEAVSCLNKAIMPPLEQHQFDALVSFVYNLGCSKFYGSTLYSLLQNKQYASAVGQFKRWVNSGGKPTPGLIKRRNSEAALFMSGDYEYATKVYTGEA